MEKGAEFADELRTKAEPLNDMLRRSCLSKSALSNAGSNTKRFFAMGESCRWLPVAI